MKIKQFFKAASAITALSLVIGMFPVFAENNDKVYSYDFENDLSLQLSDGGAKGEIVQGFGENETNVLKIEKTSTESTAAKNRVQLYPLGEEIDVPGGNKYFFVKFKIYTDGSGFDSVAVSNGTAAALCDAITVGGEGGLKDNSWNEVEIRFNISKQRTQVPLAYYTTVSDVFINGEKTVSGREKTVSQRANLNDCFDVRLLLRSEQSSTFTVYMDDLSLKTDEASEPILLDTAKCMVDGKTVIVYENTAAGELLCSDGCTLSAYRGEEALYSDDILLSGDTVSVENAIGVSNIYMVKIKGEDLKPKVICSYDFEDGAAGAFGADGAEVTPEENKNDTKYAAKIEKSSENALMFKLCEGADFYGADNKPRYFVLNFRIYSENEIRTAAVSDFSENFAGGAQTGLKSGEWNTVTYAFHADGALKYEAYVNKQKAAEGSVSDFSVSDGDIALLLDFDGEAYIDDVSLSSYGENPVCVPSVEQGDFYSVTDNKISLRSIASADMLKTLNAQSITVYSDSLKSTELSLDYPLSSGNVIVLSGEYAAAEYKVTADPDTLYFRDFEDNLSVTFTNATVAVPSQIVSGIGGKDEGDRCLEIHANEKGGGSDPSCKAALIGKTDAGKEYYRVDFNILPNDEKFTSVSLAGGWTTRMTPYVSVSESGLVRDKWNSVTFIFRVGKMYLDGSRYRLDITSDIYVNGKVYAKGEKIQTYPLDPSKNEAVFPIFLRLNSSESENEYITYVDDISVSSPSAEAVFNISAEKIAVNGGRAVVMPNTVFKLSSNYPIKSYANVLLNGESVSDELIEKGAAFMNISFENLNCGEVYMLSCGESGAVDCYGRSISFVPTAFETAAKVMSDSFSFDKSKLSQGSVTARAARLQSMTGKDESVSLIMVLSKDKKIIKTEIKNYTVGSILSSTECSMDIPDTSDGEYELRCFLWSGLEDKISYRGFIKIAE